ncbi:translation initiation factor IF-2-like [Mesocricetus auratus]|uniref:Translation initiation factor IF-2-like n=1 Tax=Mesocricetus auratus TaxID=10036 RepID=A0ABM2WL46_MESAU|nr:translation initiation factor IF-2-like [Mesocricetus auratus]
MFLMKKDYQITMITSQGNQRKDAAATATRPQPDRRRRRKPRASPGTRPLAPGPAPPLAPGPAGRPVRSRHPAHLPAAATARLREAGGPQADANFPSLRRRRQLLLPGRERGRTDDPGRPGPGERGELGERRPRAGGLAPQLSGSAAQGLGAALVHPLPPFLPSLPRRSSGPGAAPLTLETWGGRRRQHELPIQPAAAPPPPPPPQPPPPPFSQRLGPSRPGRVASSSSPGPRRAPPAPELETSGARGRHPPARPSSRSARDTPPGEAPSPPRHRSLLAQRARPLRQLRPAPAGPLQESPGRRRGEGLKEPRPSLYGIMGSSRLEPRPVGEGRSTDRRDWTAGSGGGGEIPGLSSAHSLFSKRTLPSALRSADCHQPPEPPRGSRRRWSSRRRHPPPRGAGTPCLGARRADAQPGEGWPRVRPSENRDSNGPWPWSNRSFLHQSSGRPWGLFGVRQRAEGLFLHQPIKAESPAREMAQRIIALAVQAWQPPAFSRWDPHRKRPKPAMACIGAPCTSATGWRSPQKAHLSACPECTAAQTRRIRPRQADTTVPGNPTVK